MERDGAGKGKGKAGGNVAVATGDAGKPEAGGAGRCGAGEPFPAASLSPPGGGGSSAMGCFFSRRRKPAQGGQPPLPQQAGAGQDAATAEQKAPQYSWDLRAKVRPRRQDGLGLGLGLGYRLSRWAAPRPLLPPGVCGGVCAPAGSTPSPVPLLRLSPRSSVRLFEQLKSV